MTKGAGGIAEVCVCLISPINLRKFSASRSTRLLLVDDNVNLHGNGSRFPPFHWIAEGDVLQLIYFGRTCEELSTRWADAANDNDGGEWLVLASLPVP